MRSTGRDSANLIDNSTMEVAGIDTGPWSDGYDSRLAGLDEDDNPYGFGTAEWNDWDDGWHSADGAENYPDDWEDAYADEETDA